uniref:Nitroreductase domain-containing protein n=1 Tax=Heterorhabditis bacteriophora TaxID=37862 RepID=A0A1I7WKI2_HETBA
MFVKDLKPLSNNEIINIANKLKINKFKGIFMRDTFPNKINKIEFLITFFFKKIQKSFKYSIYLTILYNKTILFLINYFIFCLNKFIKF